MHCISNAHPSRLGCSSYCRGGGNTVCASPPPTAPWDLAGHRIVQPYVSSSPGASPDSGQDVCAILVSTHAPVVPGKMVPGRCQIWTATKWVFWRQRPILSDFYFQKPWHLFSKCSKLMLVLWPLLWRRNCLRRKNVIGRRSINIIALGRGCRYGTERLRFAQTGQICTVQEETTFATEVMGL